MGGVAIVGYFVYSATSAPTNNTATGCDGFFGSLNPACFLSGILATDANAADAVTNEVNTILIIVAVVIVLIVGFLAFGPETEHIAKSAASLAVL